MRALLFGLLPIVLAGSVSAQYYEEHGMAPQEGIGSGGLLTGDVDGDGILDIVCVHWTPITVTLLHGIGNGQFATPVVLAELDEPFSPFVEKGNYALGDVDGDGDLDILFQWRLHSFLYLLRNDGSGNFASPEVLLPVTNTQQAGFRLGDLDGDGDLDILGLIYVNGYTRPMWYANNGGGGFTSMGFIGNATVNGLVIEAADVDGDGDPDVITSDLSESTCQVNYNNGAGVFGPTTTLISAPDHIHVLALGDADLDGKVDFLFTDNEHRVRYHASSLGGSGSVVLFNPSSLDESVVDEAIGDVNNDGWPDVVFVVVNWSLLTLYLAPNDGAGYISPLPQVLIATPQALFDGQTPLRIRDVDGDGVNDLLGSRGTSWYYRDGTTFYFKGNPDSGFSLPTLLVNCASQQEVVLGDVDNDSDLDAIGFEALCNRSTPLLLRNTGTGEFLRPDTVAGQNLIMGFDRYPGYAYQLHDMDGDNDLDLLFDTYFSYVLGIDSVVITGGLGWLRNDGTGYFDTIRYMGSGHYPVAFDLDQDGDADVVSMDPKLIWQQNLGNGIFGPRIQLGSLDCDQFDVADFDNDGDPDIVAEFHNASIFLMRNDGNGVLTALTMYAGLDQSPLFKLLDLNADGWLDVCYGPFQSWYRNNGGTSLTLQQVPTSPGIEMNMQVYHDLDGDGDLDVVATSLDSTLIYWSENQGSIPFRAWEVLANVHGEPWDLAFGDIDGDGLEDIAYSLIQSSNDPLYYKNPCWLHYTGVPLGNVRPVMSANGSIYPDPFSSSTTVVMPDPLRPTDRLIISDGLGRVVGSFPGTGTTRLVVQRGELSPGVYFFSALREGLLRPVGRVVVE